MSRCLSDRSIDHVVLERGEVANSWRTERWDSLRLLTPNWQCRLPGYAYEGDDPDGFMTMPEVVEFIAGYAEGASPRPVQTGTTVTSVRRTDGGYRVATDQGEWQCRDRRARHRARSTCPARARRSPRPCPPSVDDAHARSTYRNPDQLAEGGVLVVGRIGDRRADRRRDPALGPPGHAGRRRARARAARVPGPGHPLVDGRGRRARRALRRGRRHRPGPPRAVAAARRLARARRPSTSTRSPASA